MLYDIICRLMLIQHIYVGWNIRRRKLIRWEKFDIHMSFKVIVTYKHILKRHIYASVISWCSWPSLAGAPKLGESAQTWRERPNSATVTIYLWETLTAKLCYLEGLAILVSKALVFLSWIGSVGWVWWFSIRDQCFIIRWCVGARVSSIPAFRREALPTLRYFPNDTELALGMTLLELHWVLQVLCVRQEDGGGANRGS